MSKLFFSNARLFHNKLFLTSYLIISVFIFLNFSSLFAVILSSDEVASKYEIVGVISSNVVVLKDKATGNSLTRKEGELLSQELKVSKVNTDSVILTDSSGLGQRFVLEFDKFGTSAKAREEASKAFNTSTPASSSATDTTNVAKSSSNTNSDSSSNTNASSASELSQETLDLLDKFYENPDSFSSEQIKDLERRLIDGI